MSQLLPWHENVWRQIATEREQERLPHALLLSASHGTGKQHFAMALAQSVLCHDVQSDGHACGHCRSCHVMQGNSHPDFQLITYPEGKQQITVDSTRALLDFVTMTPSLGRYRVAIITPAEAMNTSAANSLLKTLEEPPAGTLIILLTGQLSRLLPTIRSRCRQFLLTPPTPKQAKQWLLEQPLQHDADSLLALSNNKPLLAQALDSDEESLALYSAFNQDLQQLLRRHLSITAFINKHKKSDVQQLLQWQMMWVIMMVKVSQTAGDESVILPSHQESIEPLVKCIPSAQQQWQLYDQLLQAMTWIKAPLNHDSVVEQFALYWLGSVSR